MHKSSPAKIWRKFNNRYKIIGVQCQNCNKIYYPPVENCEQCGSSDLIQREFIAKAKLITWSVVYAAQDGFEDNLPYIIAIVELEEGERITTQLVDIDIKDLKYGLDLLPTFRKVYAAGDDGIIHYGIKFTKV
jgi:hypothetical protein